MTKRKKKSERPKGIDDYQANALAKAQSLGFASIEEYYKFIRKDR